MARPKRQFINEIDLFGKVAIRDGEPCKHPGCLSHRTHPCEECGRIGGKGDILEGWLK